MREEVSKYPFRRPRRGNQDIQNCSQTLPIAKHPCPRWYVATAKMDRNLIQKRNNGNRTFSWEYYKDNVTVQHRKQYHDNFRR